MSDMSEYLDDCQRAAVHIEGLLTAAQTCNDPRRQEALFALIDHALAAANALQRELDVVRRPEAEA